MALSVVMPALEMAQETGKVVRWLKTEGESVSKGDMLIEIETDKAVVEIEATADGVLAGVKSHEGDVVPVGTTIAWLVAPGEKPPVEERTAAPAARTMTATPAAAPPSPRVQHDAATAEPGKSPQISPKARRLAKEKGIDISNIQGTGPDGTITSEDVMKAAEAPQHASSQAAHASAPSGLSAVASRTALLPSCSQNSIRCRIDSPLINGTSDFPGSVLTDGFPASSRQVDITSIRCADVRTKEL